MWKLKIRCLAVKNKEIESILPTAHNVYPWYVCYALCKNIFDTNLIVGSVAETHSTSSVLDFPGRMFYYSVIGTYMIGFRFPPQELLDGESNFCLFAAVGYSSVTYTIDLYARGFTKKIFELNPAIVVYVWFSVRHEYYSVHNLKATLLNSQWELDEKDGAFYYEIETDKSEWYSVTFAFTDYRSDVRYIEFENSTDITFPQSMGIGEKYILLELGAKVTAAKIVVKLPNQ